VKVEEKVIEVDAQKWFYREINPPNPSDRPPVLLLHGLPAQSYSWTVIMPQLAEKGFRAIAPDWIGFGQSTKPEKQDFPYTPDAFINALDRFLNTVELEKFSLVIQGFLGSVGLQYALRNPEKIERLVILNAPVCSEAKLPWRMKQLGLPFIGDMMTQDPLCIDRTLEAGCGYPISDDDLKIYRAPLLESSAAGRALLTTVRKLDLKNVMAEIESGFKQWPKPTLVIWGIEDTWLPLLHGEDLVKKFTQW
jgi:pimeloyl-ACP methyl ester carboxylesterase